MAEQQRTLVDSVKELREVVNTDMVVQANHLCMNSMRDVAIVVGAFGAGLFLGKMAAFGLGLLRTREVGDVDGLLQLVLDRCLAARAQRVGGGLLGLKTPLTAAFAALWRLGARDPGPADECDARAKLPLAPWDVDVDLGGSVRGRGIGGFGGRLCLLFSPGRRLGTPAKLPRNHALPVWVDPCRNARQNRPQRRHDPVHRSASYSKPRPKATN